MCESVVTESCLLSYEKKTVKLIMSYIITCFTKKISDATICIALMQ